MATYTRELSPAQVAAYHARIFCTYVENNFAPRDVEAKALELIELLKAIGEPAKIGAAVEVRKPGGPKKDA